MHFENITDSLLFRLTCSAYRLNPSVNVNCIHYTQERVRQQAPGTDLVIHTSTLQATGNC